MVMKLLSELPKGVYRTDLSGSYEGGVPSALKERILQDFKMCSAGKREDGKYSYFNSVGEFFEAWIRGYQGFRDSDESYFHDIGKGFELTIPRSRRNEASSREVTYLEGILIASDLNGITRDFGGALAFVVNDFPRKRTYTYTADKKAAFSDGGRRIILSRGALYGREELQQFPYVSGAPIKAASQHAIWTLVHVKQDEVYSVLKKIGFVFPA